MTGRRRLHLQTIFLLIHGLGWLTAMVAVTVASDNHVPPSELWTALPLGISAIVVAFHNGRRNERPPPRPDRSEE